MHNIGIDKLELYNFDVRLMDLEHIRRMARSTDDIRLIEANAKQGMRVEIYNGVAFAKLAVGVDQYNKHGGYYVNLTLTPSNAYGHNLDNMSWAEYDKWLPEVLKDIRDTYRIDLDSRRIKVKAMEINCNIPLEQKYEAYVRTTRLLMSLLPAGMKQAHDCDGGSTLLRKNGSMAVTIYNKTAQIRKKHPELADDASAPDIMRIEIRLLEARKVESAFEGNDWCDLNDEKISQYMCRYVADKMANKYEEWYHKREKELMELIEKTRAKYKTRWQEKLRHQIYNTSEHLHVPYILDIEQICQAMRRFPDPNYNCGRACESMCSSKVENDLYHNNDCGKVREILSHFAMPVPVCA